MLSATLNWLEIFLRVTVKLEAFEKRYEDKSFNEFMDHAKEAGLMITAFSLQDGGNCKDPM